MAWHHRLWNAVRRRRHQDEIDEELRFHIESTIRASIDAGASPEEARRDAFRRFGNLTAIRERTEDADLHLLGQCDW